MYSIYYWAFARLLSVSARQEASESDSSPSSNSLNQSAAIAIAAAAPPATQTAFPVIAGMAAFSEEAVPVVLSADASVILGVEAEAEAPVVAEAAPFSEAVTCTGNQKSLVSVLRSTAL